MKEQTSKRIEKTVYHWFDTFDGYYISGLNSEMLVPKVDHLLLLFLLKLKANRFNLVIEFFTV